MKTHKIFNDDSIDLVITGKIVVSENERRGYSKDSTCEIICRICTDGHIFVDKTWIYRNKNLQKTMRKFLLDHIDIWKDTYNTIWKKLSTKNIHTELAQTLCEFPKFVM